MINEKTIDRKFIFTAVNPVTGKFYTQENAIILCAKDECIIDALVAYHARCKIMETNPEHIKSFELLIQRVLDFQSEHGARKPDTVGDEIKRCIDGIGE